MVRFLIGDFPPVRLECSRRCDVAPRRFPADVSVAPPSTTNDKSK
jgi:hypothetical protein